MKKILMALAFTTFGYCSAEAQAINCTVVPKKSVTVQQTNTCKLLPYDVCKISADRRSVTCYKTTDLNTLQPWGNQTSYYGPTGPVPGQRAKFETKTIIIKGEEKPASCSRDLAAKTTTCPNPGYRICRDDNGLYGYCEAPVAAKTRRTYNGNAYVQHVSTQYPGGNSVVLK